MLIEFLIYRACWMVQKHGRRNCCWKGFILLQIADEIYFKVQGKKPDCLVMLKKNISIFMYTINKVTVLVSFEQWMVLIIVFVLLIYTQIIMDPL